MYHLIQSEWRRRRVGRGTPRPTIARWASEYLGPPYAIQRRCAPLLDWNKAYDRPGISCHSSALRLLAGRGAAGPLTAALGAAPPHPRGGQLLSALQAASPSRR